MPITAALSEKEKQDRRPGARRQCHRCGAFLLKANVSYRGKSTFCPPCSELCRGDGENLCPNTWAGGYEREGRCRKCATRWRQAKAGAKLCRDCGGEIPRDGLRIYICTPCKTAIRARRYLAQNELAHRVRVANRKVRRCIVCSIVIGGYYNKRYCPDCGAAVYVKRKRRMSKEQRIKRHHLLAGATFDFTSDAWREMLDYFGRRCAYCLRDIKTRSEKEHMTPLSRGGNHDAENIVPACRRCNAQKHTQTLLERVIAGRVN